MTAEADQVTGLILQLQREESVPVGFERGQTLRNDFVDRFARNDAVVPQIAADVGVGPQRVQRVDVVGRNGSQSHAARVQHGDRPFLELSTSTSVPPVDSRPSGDG